MATSTDGSAETTFTFPSPVYLENNTEYCFVVLSNSNEYTIWCSRIGDFDIASGQRISEQPYAGVMFKSQNASTWTADQEQDIKFKLYRCVFNTGVTGNVVFRNDDVNSVVLPLDPFYTTNSSANVVVYHPNHGLRDEDDVTISGVSGTKNGIAAAQFNDTHQIDYIDLDHYEITVGANANATGSCGDGGIIATGNLRADVINPYYETVNFPQTAMNWGVKVRDANGNLHSSYVSVVPKENTEFTDERFIFNPDNEPVGRSAEVRAQLTTTNDSVSPVIDLQRAGLIVVSNRINNDATDETNAASGNAYARYITKKISLSTPATGMRVYFTAARPALAEINVYIKYQADDDKATPFDDLPYQLLQQVDYPGADENQFLDYTFDIDELNPFSVYAVKIVMTSAETSDVPLIKDFRTIALA